VRPLRPEDGLRRACPQAEEAGLPSVGLVIHLDIDTHSRSELVTSVGWVQGEKRYLFQLADDAALDLEDVAGLSPLALAVTPAALR
jgi:hypothetical protein